MGLKGSGSHTPVLGGCWASLWSAVPTSHRELVQGPGSHQELGACFVQVSGPQALWPRREGRGSLNGCRAQSRPPSTWSTCSPAARRLSRKVSLQTPRVSASTWPAPPCCRPSLRSSSHTRTKSARSRQGQRRGWHCGQDTQAPGGKWEPSSRTPALPPSVSLPALTLAPLRAGGTGAAACPPDPRVAPPLQVSPKSPEGRGALRSWSISGHSVEAQAQRAVKAGQNVGTPFPGTRWQWVQG